MHFNYRLDASWQQSAACRIDCTPNITVGEVIAIVRRLKDRNKFQYDEMVYHTEEVNFLKPTGHVMHQQFNIQQLYALPTMYLCVLYLSENKQRLVPFTS